MFKQFTSKKAIIKLKQKQRLKNNTTIKTLKKKFKLKQ